MRSSVFAFACVVAATRPGVSAALDASAFAYDSRAPLEVRYGAEVRRDGFSIREVSFASESRRVTGAVVEGRGLKPHPGVLFVHWLGDEKTTNRTEFEPDAIALACKGVTSVLIDAMWARCEKLALQ